MRVFNFHIMMINWPIERLPTHQLIAASDLGESVISLELPTSFLLLFIIYNETEE